MFAATGSKGTDPITALWPDLTERRIADCTCDELTQSFSSGGKGGGRGGGQGGGNGGGSSAASSGGVASNDSHVDSKGYWHGKHHTNTNAIRVALRIDKKKIRRSWLF